MTEAARRPAIDPRRVGIRHGWTIGVYVLLAIALAAEIAIAPRFTSFDLESLLYAALPLAFAAMAQAVVVISGGIDLSVGPVMALVNVSSARLMLGEEFGTAIAIALGLIAAGAVIGALTGAAIVVTRVPDIVVTLATSFIWAGPALYVLPEPGGGAPAEFLELVTGSFFWEWVPNGLVVLVIAIIVLLVLSAVSVWRGFPSQLSYANEAFGGPSNAHTIFAKRGGLSR